MKAYRLWWVLVVIMLWLSPCYAALTNTWSFSNSVEYTVSDSNLIEVAQGVARLILQKAERYDTVLADYQGNGASASQASIGPDVTISLGKVGDLYKRGGEFTSRILDGGDGVQWQRFNTKVYNLLLENAFGGVPESISGLIALYRFDSTWANAVGTDSVVPFSGASFSSSAKLGSASCSLDGSGYAACTNIVLNGALQSSISLWLKLRTYTTSAGIVSSRTGSDVNGLRQDTTAGNLRFYVNNVAFTVATKMPLNEWFFLVATWSSADKIAKVYYNGVLVGTGTINTPSINQTAPFLIGKENFLPATSGWMDDVAIYNRALSQDEITKIYKNSQSMRFQIRAGETLGELPSLPFVGPAGVTNAYYVDGNQELIYGGEFKHWGQFAQYRAYFAGPSDGLQSPFLDAAGLIGNVAEAFDDTMGDFSKGELGTDLAINPAMVDTPYIGLAKQSNGGYFSDGKFTSSPIDGGGPILWERLKWGVPSGLNLSTNNNDIVGLWHMEDGFGDVGPYEWGNTPAGMSYSTYSKIDSYSAVFNGGSYVSIGSLSPAVVNAMEFWIRDENADDGILELANNATSKVYLAISGHLVTPVGFVSPPILTINGSVTSRRLMPGWNHVGVTMSEGIRATEFTVGVADGVYMRGMMDEMALYSRAVTPAEFKNHYIAGRRISAGRVKFQIRAGDSLPLTGNFVGPDDVVSAYFLDNNGGTTLPASTTRKRFIQYQASFSGDGVTTPTFWPVIFTTSSGGTYSNASEAVFLKGVFDSTAWIGDEIKLFDRATVPGLVNLKADVSILGLWHMDEALWSSVQPAQDSSYDPKPGTVFGAKTVSPGLVGVACGQFNGTNQYLSISGVSLSGDFSILAWFKTRATNRSAVVSRSDGAFSLEINNAAPGRVAFVLNNGGGDRTALASLVNLNDGNWHHLAGIKKGQTIHIYVDGVAAGSAVLTSSAGLGSGGLYVARHGALNNYLACNVDELVIYNRALSDGEVRQVAAMDANTKTTGYYTSGVFDATMPAIWESLLWRENASFGKALVNNDFTLMGLWHADESNGTAVADSSGKGHLGNIVGTVSRSTGKFGNALTFDGSGGYVSIDNSSFLEPTVVSVEAWVKPGAVDSRVVFDKRTAGTGYSLGTDANGKPYFWVDEVVATSFAGLQPDNWYHLAGVYDGSTVKIYVNGDMMGSAAGSDLDTTGNDASIGIGYSGGNVAGAVDEVAVWGRALNAEEIADHARSGAGTLRVHVKFANDTASLDALPFIGWDGTSNTYYTAASGSSLLSLYPLGQYFQYRVALTAEDGARAPVFQGATVNQTGYPINNPWVTPATGYGRPFLGTLTALSHILATNTEDAVRYQISGNNGTNWYWWNGGQWDYISSAVTNTDTLWTMANSRATVDAHIGTFYDDLYAKTGGVFKFKAYLKSDAVNQVALDEVKLLHAPGRIVVTVPNGQEVGNDAWLIGVPYNITWSSTGTVSGQLMLERSLDGGNGWTLIASNVPNTGVYSNWPTPSTPSSQCRVRITDQNDAFITDKSDADFSLVQRYRVTAPNGGEKWYSGRSYLIKWWSAIGLGTLADIHYASDGANFSYLVKSGADNTPGGVTNAFLWQTPPANAALLSEAGKIRIKTFGGSSGIDESDYGFTLAGVEITRPPAGALVNRRSTYPIEWYSAGASNAVKIEFSSNGGGSWTNVTASSPNVAGANTYDWTPNVPPTDTARLRITSLSDSNVVGVTSNFVLADVDIVAPTNGTIWGMRLTNSIVWMAGGAGTNANLYYSTNSGVRWTPIVENYRTYSGSNSYRWLVEPYPGSHVRIKIESLQDTNLYAISEDFKIAGVRVVSPNGDEKWQLDMPNTNKWAYQSVGESATLEFSYDGGITYRTIGGPGVPLINEALEYTPTYPTIRARTKIIADDPAPFTNMVDVSDKDFIVGGILVKTPSNSSVYTLGFSGPVEWVSAGADDPLGQARLSYSADGVTNDIITTGNSDSFPGDNSYQWAVNVQSDPSASARVIVRSGPYTGFSSPFVLRGIKFSSPNASSIYSGGSVGPLVWKSAGIDESALGYFYLSTDGGVNFGATPLNVSQVWPVISGAYPWSIDVNEDPTTNAVVKYVVASSAATQDVGYAATTLPFVLRGFKFIAPLSGAVWKHNTTNAIVWRSARAGSVVSLYYSADGATYDAVPIAANVPLIDGVTNYAWRVEPSRMPSTNARVKAVTSVATTISQPFTVQGIKVLYPLATDIWALDETNRISWVGVGSTPPYTISLIQGGTNVMPIASGVFNTEYDWVVPLAAIGSNSVIRVTDGTFTGDSLPFRIVGMPTVEIIAPAPGDLWKVSQPYNIVWSKGGKMENNFRVMFSRDPYVATNDIFNGIASYNPIDNTYSLPDPWIVPDRLGNTRIIVQHNLRSDIWDVSETFKIVPYFRLAYPNGGETNLYARKPHTIVSWFTRGSQGLVDLYYSADPLHASNSWVKINDTPIANNGEGLADIVTTYDWTIADLGGDVSSVRLRVAATDEPGAYDDSDSDFSILYFKIRWNVYDAATLNPLTQLSVSDSSGWSEANLISPVQRAYPYGIFSTVWAREFYNNNVIFNWESDPSRTINVPMSFSSVDPDYNVMASFEYDTSNAVFRVNTWIERRGVILPTPTRSIVTLFDASGNTAGQVTSSTYDPSGVFWMTLPGTLARGSVYFAKVEIEFSGTVYSSGLTFNLRVPTDDERVQQILSGVNSVGTNLTNLAVAQALFRASATEKLDLLTNATVSIQAGVTNIEAKLDLLSTQALAQLTAITNTIGVIGPGETNILDLVKRLPSSMGSAQREARILTRPTTVKYGSSVNVLYRTLEGMTATYQVLPAGGGAAIRSGPMGGGVGGIYEATLTADWGYGDYQIVCADSSSPVSSDRMIVKVTSMELDDLAGTVVSISGQVSRVEETLTDMRGVQSNIYNIVGTLDDLTNLVSQVQIMTNAMEKIAGLTNMSGQLNFMTNLLSEMAVVTNVAPQIASITNMMGLLAPVTNFGPQIAYMTNVVGQLTAMTNIGDQVAVMTNAMDKMSGLTNMSGQLNYLTNMVGQLGPLTNLASQLGGLTGMASQVTFLTNVVGQLTAITNIGDQVAVMTNSLARVAALTNINEQMSYVTNVIGSLGSITNLGPQVDALNAAIGQIVALTNMANQVDYLVSVIDQVVAVTNITPQIAILTNSLTQITALTNMSGQLTFLADTMTQMVGLTNMPSQLALMTNTLTQFAGLTNVAFQMSYVTNVIGQLTGVTNISAQVADMTNAIGRVAALTNMSGQLSYMTNIIGQLSGVTNIAAQVSDMTNSIAKVAALTNMSGQLSYMTNVIGQLSGITNISAQVADMTNALGRVAGLTNMSDQLRYMTNVIGQLAGMTNISAQVAVMTNAIGQLSGITNISAQVATITNALAGLVGLGDVPGQLSYVTNVIGSLSAATNLGTQIATMTNAIASLSAMTNMATDVAQVGSNVTVMMNEVAGLGATYEAMTSMQGVVSNVEAMAVTMETRIGREGDTADSSTVFGMLSYIEEKISQSGADGTGAILKGVNSAKGAAQKAASAASKMKDVAGAGKLDQVLSELDAIQRSLSSVKGDVEGLPESMTTEAMVKVIKQAMDDIRNVAGGRGLPTEGIGQTGGALEAGSLSDPQSVSKLLNSIAETKAMMQAMQGLMDEAVNKPVVVDWLEGGTGK